MAHNPRWLVYSRFGSIVTSGALVSVGEDAIRFRKLPFLGSVDVSISSLRSVGPCLFAYSSPAPAVEVRYEDGGRARVVRMLPLGSLKRLYAEISRRVPSNLVSTLGPPPAIFWIIPSTYPFLAIYIVVRFSLEAGVIVSVAATACNHLIYWMWKRRRGRTQVNETHRNDS